MQVLLKNTFLLFIILFIAGNGITFLGLMKGQELAVHLSRPKGASSWTTSTEQMVATQYSLAILGISITMIAMIIFSVAFYYWFSMKIKEIEIK